MVKTYSLLLAGMIAVAPLAASAMDQKELEAIGKILALSKDIPGGNVTVAVVYDGANAASNGEMEKIKGLIGGGFKAPMHTLTFKGVAAGGDLGGAKVVILTEGLGGAAAAAGNAAKSGKALCATASLAYVEGGNCMLGVDVGSSVKIVMHSKSIKDAGLQFDPALQFMVSEI